MTILKTETNGNDQKFYKHLTNGEDNESVHWFEPYGIAAHTPGIALRTLKAMGRGRPIKHFSISPSPDCAEWTEAQWDRAWQVLEEEFGIKDIPHIRVRHRKKRTRAKEANAHEHASFPAVNPYTGKVLRFSHEYLRQEKIARILEYEFGEPFTCGAHNREVVKALVGDGRPDVADAMIAAGLTGKERPSARRTHAEHQQAKRTRSSPEYERMLIWSAWNEHATKPMEPAAFEALGMVLAAGDKPGAAVVVMISGAVHELGRALRAHAKAHKLEAPCASDIQSRLRGVSDLPCVSDAKRRVTSLEPDLGEDFEANVSTEFSTATAPTPETNQNAEPTVVVGPTPIDDGQAEYVPTPKYLDEATLWSRSEIVKIEKVADHQFEVLRNIPQKAPADSVPDLEKWPLHRKMDGAIPFKGKEGERGLGQNFEGQADGDRHHSDWQHRPADGKAHELTRTAIGRAEPRRSDSGPSGHSGRGDPAPGQGDRPLERNAWRAPPPEKAELHARPDVMVAMAVAKDPLARPPLVENPNWRPPYVIKKYVTYLAEWSRRKLIEPAVEPVLFALGVARKAVEDLGEVFRDVDGLKAVDHMLGRMVSRINPDLVRVHEVAVEIDQRRRVVLNATSPLRAGAEPQENHREAKGRGPRGLE